ASAPINLPVEPSWLTLVVCLTSPEDQPLTGPLSECRPARRGGASRSPALDGRPRAGAGRRYQPGQGACRGQEAPGQGPGLAEDGQESRGPQALSPGH